MKLKPQCFLPACLLLTMFSCSLHAQDDSMTPQHNIKEPSPDGEFAFLESVPPAFSREGSVDLIEQKSQKVLLRVVDEINVGWSAHWAPDSKHFVVVSKVGHAIQGIDVYGRKGAIFHEVKLPELAADVPKRMTCGKRFPHFSELNYESMGEWISPRAFTLEITTGMDGDGPSVSATRNVVLGLDQNEKIKILKSRIKYETQDE